MGAEELQKELLCSADTEAKEPSSVCLATLNQCDEAAEAGLVPNGVERTRA